MMNPDASQPLRSRGQDGPRFDREAGRSPRVINTAAVERPIQAPTASSTALNQRDANRADRIRDLVDRNREGRNRDGRNRGGRNRGGSVVAVPGASVEGQTGAVTSPTTDQREGRRHGGDDDHDGTHRHGGNRHREWHERHKDDPDFERKHRRWHNREWYRRNYNRFVLFGGGYYYWNRGYWYPAYGYHPTYSTYIYDAPIYSYNGLPPGQVLSMVQMQLQQRGYYNAAVDGTYGPVTRQALLNYQADHGLPMTGQIDQETLLSLGFE